MARKTNSETARLLEVRNDKINEISQIADQMQRLRDTATELQSDIASLDFALKILDPSHVPMDAQSSTNGRLLIDAKPTKVEPVVDVTANHEAVVEETTPTKQATSKASTKGKAKKVTATKKTSGHKKKSEPLPKTAIDAAEKIKGTRSTSMNDKEVRAREVVNGYMSDFKAGDEIEAILKKGPKRGMTVNVIAEAFVKTHPLANSDGDVMMILKNRISSQIAHLMKKGLVAKGKPEGETLTHYSILPPDEATPAKATEDTSETPAETAEQAA